MKEVQDISILASIWWDHKNSYHIKARNLKATWKPETYFLNYDTSFLIRSVFYFYTVRLSLYHFLPEKGHTLILDKKQMYVEQTVYYNQGMLE